MVLARLDRSKDDEGGPLRLRRTLRRSQRAHAEPRRQAGRIGQMLARAERGKLIERSLAVADNAGRRRQHRPDSRAMLFGLASAAKFGMSDRDEIVDQVDRPDLRPRHPLAKAGGIQARVADVQVKTAVALAVEMGEAPDGAGQECPPEGRRWRVQYRKEILGCFT